MPVNFSLNSQFINAVLRILQVGLSLVALSTLATGFAWQSVPLYGETLTTMIATPTTNFMMLLLYTTMLYSFWHVVAIEWTSFVPKMRAPVEMAIDAAFVLIYVISGILFAMMPYVRHCGDRHFDAIRCHNLTTSVVFCFMTMFAYLCSIVWVVLQNVFGNGGDDSIELAHVEEGEPHGEPTTCEYTA